MTPAFSFLFFSDVRDDVSDREKYLFMRDVTLFADREGFTAIYLPERHFYEFGSIYPNQAIVASWLAPQTQRIRFRTAGVSLPLHHPAEVVEWWAMVDVLTGGRVDLGFGSGWNRADFILSPANYSDRRQVMTERIDVVRRLWRGESVTFMGPDGESTPIRCFPRPTQRELRVWLLVAQSTDSFGFAGRAGFNVFTMLYGYDFDTLAAKINVYRTARRDAGLDPNAGVVSVMLHTFVHARADHVRRVVETPFRRYIRSTLDGHLAAREGQSKALTSLSDDEKQAILEYSFRRYYQSCALFGSVDECRSVVDRASAAGVDEIACLVDFGADYREVIDSLPYLRALAAPSLNLS